MIRSTSRAFRAAPAFSCFGRSAKPSNTSYFTAGASSTFGTLPSSLPVYAAPSTLSTLSPPLSSARTLSTMTCRGAFSFTLCWIDDDTS
ncbi:hypothetical protein BDV3_005760 [Batrachochytrium dendrobatidis]|nr:hypothetical protein O5D80_004950 [Batrachochytrium dendrobatidis]KAJ8326180.1 hypothetical protein O5D80_004950 [Batrachochytrium dendrobatidis]KAK5671298.1 hypothetical protein QVD99_002324 [Batrachochytrium dendrobatidis]KAK5671299.1 hypothetical protein QVD99_002324 [Batrachochytrium dendrobatidis]